MNTSTFRLRPTLAAIALLAITCGAQAQTTIDQNKALAGSVTPGDSPGFPVTLSVPGAYKLTGNLVVPAGTGGIVIAARNVTLDLNGFSIVGPVVCTGAGKALTCAGVKQGGGIGFYTGMSGATIRNGTVRGFGFYGVAADQGATINNVTATSNGGYGIAVNGGSTVSNSMANDNGDVGFLLFSGGVITNSRAHNNKSYGIFVDDGESQGHAGMAGEVRDTYASRNGDAGFKAYGIYPVSWIGNTASTNGDCFSGGKLVRNNVCDGVAN